MWCRGRRGPSSRGSGHHVPLNLIFSHRVEGFNLAATSTGQDGISSKETDEDEAFSGLDLSTGQEGDWLPSYPCCTPRERRIISIDILSCLYGLVIDWRGGRRGSYWDLVCLADKQLEDLPLSLLQEVEARNAKLRRLKTRRTKQIDSAEPEEVEEDMEALIYSLKLEWVSTSSTARVRLAGVSIMTNFIDEIKENYNQSSSSSIELTWMYDWLLGWERERERRNFWYSSDTTTMVEKEYNDPHKKNATTYSSMKTNTMAWKNIEMINSVTVTMK